MLGAWSRILEQGYCSPWRAFCQYHSQIPCLLPQCLHPPPDTNPCLSDQESLAQLRDSGSPRGGRWFSQSILTRRESTCSCPQFHTSSLSLSLLHPMASYLEGMTSQAFLGKNKWEGTSPRSTSGSEKSPPNNAIPGSQQLKFGQKALRVRCKTSMRNSCPAGRAAEAQRGTAAWKNTPADTPVWKKLE